MLGCVYFYPTDKADFDVEVFLWVRESALVTDLDAELSEAVRNWLETDWPFDHPAYPGREIDWDAWEALPTD